MNKTNEYRIHIEKEKNRVKFARNRINGLRNRDDHINRDHTNEAKCHHRYVSVSQFSIIWFLVRIHRHSAYTHISYICFCV